jgi:radical SAM protein with 4Fe4S-binding SPASM domain
MINITTNGTLLSNNLDAIKYIRQLNISLDATNDREIIKEALRIKTCFVNFRIWNNNSETLRILSEEMHMDILSVLNEKSINKTETNFTLKDNFYISIQNEWEWPDINSKTISNGYCHALKDHIAVLVDGTIVPCCLDNDGAINLGNIFKDNFEDILNSEKTIKMIDGFKNRVCTEELCKKCTYKLRF